MATLKNGVEMMKPVDTPPERATQQGDERIAQPGDPFGQFHRPPVGRPHVIGGEGEPADRKAVGYRKGWGGSAISTALFLSPSNLSPQKSPGKIKGQKV